MITSIGDGEIDGLIAWISSHRPELDEPPTPSAKLLDMAWKTLQAYQAARTTNAPRGGRFNDEFLLMAASGGNEIHSGSFVSEDGKWELETYLPIDPADHPYILCSLRDRSPEALAEVEGLIGVLKLEDGTQVSKRIVNGDAEFQLEFSTLTGQRRIGIEVAESSADTESVP